MNVYYILLVVDKCHKIVSLGKKGKRGYFNVSGFLLLKICWGVCCVQQRPSFLLENKIPGTALSPYSWCTEADSLQPVCRQPNRNSPRSTEVNILSQRGSTRVGTCTYCPFFIPLGESGQGHTLNSAVAFWMCWLGELLEMKWITRSGCSKSALHPLLLGCFIWVVCWSQGTAFCLSKKAVQYYLIMR